MRVVCLHSDKNRSLTLGKIYSVIDEVNGGYRVINDDGKLFYYHVWRFGKLDDIRDGVLDEILQKSV